jgi:membrane-bound lytic murein transglycosylase D
MPVLRPLLDASLLAVDPVFGVALVESETSEGSVELAGTEPKARVSVAKGEGVIAQAARAPAAGPMPAETQPELAADPADYQVAANETIEVQVAETLGHYADWLELHSRQLRRLNGLRSTQLITVGERIKLDFARVSPREFEGRRVEYHRSHQAEFFERHRINGVCEHTVRPDDSLWTLALQDYEIPLWLLRQYNPDVDFDSVLPLGGTVRIPLVEPLAGDAGPAPVRLRATVLSCRAGTA